MLECGFRLCIPRNLLHIGKRQILAGQASKPEALPGYKQFRDGYIIRPMRLEDIKYPIQYFATLGIVGRDDFRVGFQCAGEEEGRGFYVGEFEGKIVSSIAYIELAPNIFLGGIYYVMKQYRQSGFGSRLRKHVEPILKGGGKTITADTYPHVTKMLMKQPEDGWTFHWHSQRAVGHLPRVKELHKGIVPVEKVPFEKLIEYDNRCYLRPNVPCRKRFLEKWTSLIGGATHVALNGRGDIIGYGCRRRAIQSDVHMIGPLYADQPRIAQDILASLAIGTNRGDKFTIEFWEKNEGAMDIVNHFDFKEAYRLDHMSQNGPAADFNPKVFAVTSLDVCSF